MWSVDEQCFNNHLRPNGPKRPKLTSYGFFRELFRLSPSIHKAFWLMIFELYSREIENQGPSSANWTKRSLWSVSLHTKKNFSQFLLLVSISIERNVNFVPLWGFSSFLSPNICLHCYFLWHFLCFFLYHRLFQIMIGKDNLFKMLLKFAHKMFMRRYKII